jgi:hypothetical protein
MVDEETPVAVQAASDALSGADKIPPERKALVSRWLREIKADKQHWKPVFERMEKCEQLAAEGADDKYVESDQYVVPIIVRHVNQSVAQLYAKDPRATATRRKRLLYAVWDGKPDSLAAAMQAMAPPVEMPTDPITGGPLDPATAQPWQPDPQAVALLQEVQAGAAEMARVDKMAATVELLWKYYTGEQGSGFKEKMKLLVRRAKIHGVGYVKLAFQRELTPRPEAAAGIDDSTTQLTRLDQLTAGLQRPESENGYGPESAEAEAANLITGQLQAQEEIVVREGPIFDFPSGCDIIPSRKLKHLKTFTGAPHVTHEFHKSAAEIERIYGVDIRAKAAPYNEAEARNTEKKHTEETLYCVWEVQDKSSGQFMTLCDGYYDFLKAPAEPDTRIERFWTLFPLVFNEVENRKKPFPPSDVWLLRHTQQGYNVSREGLREHRQANRPGHVTGKGKLAKIDKDKLTSRGPHEVIELQGLQTGMKVEDLLQRLPHNPIDPALYDTRGFFEDVLRTVGAQEANLGGTSSSTATESSIAEQSRSASLADNVDDLDDLLTALAKAFGQLCFLELGKETVQQIVGPGAVWPDLPQTREEVARDLLLEIKAGSSGRPNKAADLANLERAWPVLSATPGINPQPVAKKLAHLLDIDVEELYVEGLPSFNAMNALMGKPEPTSADPMAQGGMGAANAPSQPAPPQAGQPAYPAASGPISA